MKKIVLLLALSGLLSTISKAQNVICSNVSSCDVLVNFVLIDPTTCLVVSTAPPFVVPAGAMGLPFFIPWAPMPPAPGPYVPAAYISFVTCPGPSVLVGGTCGLPPTASIPVPPGCSCGPDLVDFPTAPITFPVPPGFTIPLNIHP